MAYKMAGPAVCRQARKAQRRCKDTEGLSWLVRAEGLLVRSGGVEGGSPTTASAAGDAPLRSFGSVSQQWPELVDLSSAIFFMYHISCAEHLPFVA
jgi:hypothetical protein